MYSSVASLHIALAQRIQQQNSNRKAAILPQQYDMVLNDAILTVLKLRLSARLNPIRVGFEESTNNYDSLKSLKRTCSPTCYFDSVTQRFYFELPSNYYMYDTLKSKIYYKKDNTQITTKDITVYKAIVNFDSYLSSKTEKVIEQLQYKFREIDGNNTTITDIDTRNIYKVGISNKSSFYYFNLIKDFFRSEKNIDCYYENYNESYNSNSLIFINAKDNLPISVVLNGVSVNNISVTRSTITNKVIDTTNKTYINLGYKKIDLVSSDNKNNDENDYYSNKNIHLNPKFIMENNRIYLTTDPKFYYDGIILEYIKQPRLIDSVIGQMTDMEITEDILDIATRLLMATLNIKDTSYEQQVTQQKQ